MNVETDLNIRVPFGGGWFNQILKLAFKCKRLEIALKLQSTSHNTGFCLSLSLFIHPSIYMYIYSMYVYTYM